MLDVRGESIEGWQLRCEKQTLIVALMRGGESMALGISAVFPRAPFHHSFKQEDIFIENVRGMQTVLVVDSVINSGKTVVSYVKHLRKLQPDLSIVVVSGVVQGRFVSGGSFDRLVEEQKNLSLVTLRVSDNRFTGRGPSDTGNRLFSTTHLA